MTRRKQVQSMSEERNQYAVVPFDEMGLSLPALGWWFPELSALFLVAGVVIGLIDRMSEEELVETYVAGCADLLGVAFIIGISQGITVLMNDGAITDTVLAVATTATVRFTNSNGTEYQQPSKHTW